MKSLVTILLVLVAIGTANANWDASTGLIADMTDGSVYAWNITHTLAPGETITGATLHFDDLQDLTYSSGDKFYVHLLDNVTAADGWVRVGNDGAGDYFDSHNAQNVLVGTKIPTNNHDMSFDYNIDTTTLGNYMADGKLAFGFDPDCDWTVDNIKFTLSTTTNTVPAPGAMLLGGIGVSIVGWLKRRRAL